MFIFLKFNVLFKYWFDFGKIVFILFWGLLVWYKFDGFGFVFFVYDLKYIFIFLDVFVKLLLYLLNFINFIFVFKLIFF